MVNKISAIIVEDESKSIAALQNLLDVHCQHVDVIATASNVKEAIETIDSLKPNLVFLDIELPDGDGFEVLEKVNYKLFEIIFITAYDQYAVKAFELSALHYILKPINYLELIEAVDRFGNRNKSEDVFDKKFAVLKNSLTGNSNKIILPDTSGLQIVDIDDIVRCEADHNYTICYLTNSKKLTISKSLNKFETLLEDVFFCRIHNKHLVNLKYIKKYNKGSGGSITMNDGAEINVSKGRKNEFLEKLNRFAKSL